MSDIRAVAKQYIESAWSVVPLNPGEKRASVKWQSTTYKPSDFNDDSNIAVKMGDASNGLVDVDCDHPFAVAAAKELLPITGRVFGRSSKPSSHYLFVCPDIKTTQFTDVKADGRYLANARGDPQHERIHDATALDSSFGRTSRMGT
jgi:hypothetical protein